MDPWMVGMFLGLQVCKEYMCRKHFDVYTWGLYLLTWKFQSKPFKKEN